MNKGKVILFVILVMVLSGCESGTEKNKRLVEEIQVCKDAKLVPKEIVDLAGVIQQYLCYLPEDSKEKITKENE